MTKQKQIQQVKGLLSGDLLSGDIVPLFWEKQGEFFVSGNHKLPKAEWERLNKKYPCYVAWEEIKTY